MRFAVNAPPFAEPAALVDLGVATERAGWDAFFLWDHMVVDRNGVAIVDPWVVLGAVAARTDRIRLGTCVTPLARRRPEKVARETATLDRLSSGRLVLGVGLGHPAEEYTTFGDSADLPVLAARTDESLAVLTGLWSGEPFEHDGTWFHVERVRFVPTPAQRPRPPVWIACALPSRRAIAWMGSRGGSTCCEASSTPGRHAEDGSGPVQLGERVRSAANPRKCVRLWASRRETCI